MKRWIYITVTVVALLPTALLSQERVSRKRHEVGLWIGASNPIPGTAVDDVLDANVGGGGFYRVNWPWVFYTELGFSWSQYFSQTTQKLTAVPVHLALAYRLPLDFKVQTYIKLGGGAAWLEVRPANRSGWEPLFFGGLEFSIPASRRLRVGLRLDYDLIYEKHLDPPPEAQYSYFFPGLEDPRDQLEVYEIDNGHFFHFGLMVSFII
ncbi:MAG: hypothetical protein KDK30_15185 [Leptospiraceae bacterium]|nr:hypothetical protein [Leptospiraceae bacterium]MCB1315259.1 hypothetical protein [Leptospiraceae bacterium]